MPRRPTLKVADDGDTRQSDTQAHGAVRVAAAESRRELLRALRNRIATEIDDGVPARDLASLSKRLLDISQELEDLEAAADGGVVGAAAGTPDEPWPA